MFSSPKVILGLALLLKLSEHGRISSHVPWASIVLSNIDSFFFPAHIQTQIHFVFGTQIALGSGLLVDVLGFGTCFSSLGLENVKSTFTLGVGLWPLSLTEFLGWEYTIC